MPRSPRVAIALGAITFAAIAGCSNAKPATHAEATPHAAAPAELPLAARGRVVTRTFHSAALGVDKAYVVYLPVGYDTRTTARWPVLYYLHGLTGNETNWVKHGHLDDAADHLGLDAIVVMPDGDDSFYADSPRALDYDACMKDGTGLFLPQMQPHAKTCVRHHAYETYIVTDLIGDVDATYRTIATREGRAIAGMSMGGFGALELALRHRDVFAAAASHSGVDALLYAGPHPYVSGKAELLGDVALWGTGAGEIGPWVRGIFGDQLANWQAHDPAKLIEKLAPGELALYLDCGTEDGFGLDAGAAYLHELLTARHIDHAYFEGPGGHDFAFWVPRLTESLKFLAAHVAHASAPAPAR